MKDVVLVLHKQHDESRRKEDMRLRVERGII